MSVVPGKAQSQSSNSTKSFASALAVNGALLLVEVGAFLILKRRLWRIYSPRTVLPPPDKRAPELPPGIWRWLPALLMTPQDDIIHKNGLDAYMFLRFIRLLMIIFSVFTVLTFVVIIPVDAVSIISGNDGLDRITWQNITDPKNQGRFTAHVVVVWVLTAFVIYMINGEMLHFVHMRQQFLISKSHSRLAQARTVLVTPVPDELANEHDLRTFASFVPGGIDRVWLYRDTSALNDLFNRRVAACKKLETAEAKILKAATLAWRRREKAFKKKQKDQEQKLDDKLVMPPPSRELLDDLVPPNKRPQHRNSLFGPKVDTIIWCKDEISQLNKEIKVAREHIVKGKFLGSAFIRCNLQLGAHVLAQCLSYHEPLKMNNKWMEAHPRDIVWANLDDGALEMTSRYVTSWFATAGLIVLWAFPVSFIGSLSNLSQLCLKVHWLAWVCNVSPEALGVIQGVLPPLLLAICFIILPFILRALAWYECIPRYSLISVSVYRRFYFFLLIHGFLIVTITSGITRAIEDIINNPTQTVQELSAQLPGASVFFLTYMVTQGLAGAGSALVQLAPLIIHYVRKWFLGRTPRQAYEVTFKMPAADFGTTLPRLSLLATIALAYSVLSPLINLVSLISFAMFYMSWKFLLTYVFDQPDERETGGMYFPMAITNLFVGLYIEQICLSCLLFLKAKDGGITAIIQAVFMLILLFLTVCAHGVIHNSYDPMKKYLPMSLATKKMATRYKQEISGEDDGEIDLFNRERYRSVRKRVKATAKRLDNKLDELKAKVKGDDHQDQQQDDSAETKREDAPDGHTEEPQKPTAETTALARRGSKDSKASKASSASSKSNKTDEHIPRFDAAAPALRDEDENEEDPNEHAFDHPSIYVDQVWIWIPKDTLNLSEYLTNELKAMGVEASDVGANMDAKGVVEVSRNPPDEEWSGGHDL